MAGAQGSLPRGWGTSKAGDSLASLGSPVPCPITLLDEVSTVGMVRGGSVSTPPAEANGAGAARTESTFYSGEYWDLAGTVLVPAWLHHHKNWQDIVELGPGFHTALNLVADTVRTCSREGACAVSQEVLLFVIWKTFLVLWHGVLLLFLYLCFCTLLSLAISSFVYTSEAFYQQHLLPGACKSLLESHTGIFICARAVFVWLLTFRLSRYLADTVRAV